MIVLLAALVMAARTSVLGNTSVDVKVYSTGLRLVFDEDVDLVPLDSRGGGVLLESAWIALRAVDVTPLDVQGDTVRVAAERAIATGMLNRLRIGQGCDVQIESMAGGFIRLAARPASSHEPVCSVTGAVKADRSLNALESQDRASLLEGVPPSAALQFMAEPTFTQPAIVVFHPAEALQISRIGVSLLSFETSERHPYPVGSILRGTIGFPGLRDGEVKLLARDKLSLERVRGTMELMIGDSLRTEFVGQAAASSISSDDASLKPTLFEQVQSSALLLAIGTVVPVLAGAFEWLEQRRRGKER
ncbi:MAG TPA: hypothetical protein VFS20_19550 [Longimicrobium sp.]|nr:hypothetical protein [Longimicrobium sp.]